MFDSNNYQKSCGFSEQIVSYIYDEMNVSEKASFDVHIAKCTDCSDELAGFGLVRSKIFDWKSEEFLQLATPKIQIPYEVASRENKISFFSSVREFFAFSQVWMKTATAFASLAIVAGITFLAFNAFNSNEPKIDIANNIVPVSSPTPQVVVAKTQPDVSNDYEVKEKPTKPLTPVNNANKEVVKVIEKTKPVSSTTKTEKTVIRTTVVKSPKKEKSNNVEIVNNDEDEDDSLRLLDIFDEIGTETSREVK
jgi:hypothetical protein